MAAADNVQAIAQLTGIQGESTVRGFEDAVTLHGVQVSLGSQVGCGDGTSEVVLLKAVDKSSPKLLEHVTQGTPIPEVRITLRKSGAEPFTFMEYRLTDVVVLRSRVAGGPSFPQEELRLDYTSMSWTYTAQRLDGTAGAAVTGSHDKGLAGPTSSCPTESPLGGLGGAVNVFADIAGIPGESNSSRHTDAVDVTNFSTGLRKAGSGCDAVTAPAVDAFTFTHRVDAASAPLFEKAGNGQALSSVVLDVDSAGGTQDLRLRYTLENVTVKGITTDGSKETVSLEVGGLYRLDYVLVDASGETTTFTGLYDPNA